MDDVSNDVKIQIAEINLQRVMGSIYENCISKRVLDKVGDKDAAAQIVKQLEKLEKMKDEYQVVITELKKDKQNA